MSKSERIRILKEEILEAEKLEQPARLCQLYALHKTEDEKPREKKTFFFSPTRGGP